jgi:hypothetical protein
MSDSPQVALPPCSECAEGREVQAALRKPPTQPEAGAKTMPISSCCIGLGRYFSECVPLKSSLAGFLVKRVPHLRKYVNISCFFGPHNTQLIKRSEECYKKGTCFTVINPDFLKSAPFTTEHANI